MNVSDDRGNVTLGVWAEKKEMRNGYRTVGRHCCIRRLRVGAPTHHAGRYGVVLIPSECADLYAAYFCP